MLVHSVYKIQDKLRNGKKISLFDRSWIWAGVLAPEVRPFRQGRLRRSGQVNLHSAIFPRRNRVGGPWADSISKFLTMEKSLELPLLWFHRRLHDSRVASTATGHKLAHGSICKLQGQCWAELSEIDAWSLTDPSHGHGTNSASLKGPLCRKWFFYHSWTGNRRQNIWSLVGHISASPQDRLEGYNRFFAKTQEQPSRVLNRQTELSIKYRNIIEPVSWREHGKGTGSIMVFCHLV